MRILFVENHAVFAETVRAAFLSEHQVEVVPSVRLAVEALERRAFDVVLVDYDLDDQKGDVLVTQLRTTGKLLVVGVSSHAEGNAALLHAGAHAVCPKLEFAEIADVLDRAGRGKAVDAPRPRR